MVLVKELWLFVLNDYKSRVDIGRDYGGQSEAAFKNPRLCDSDSQLEHCPRHLFCVATPTKLPSKNYKATIKMADGIDRKAEGSYSHTFP